MASLPPKYNPSDSELLNALHLLHKKSPKLVRSSKYEAPEDASIVVESWKMNEFKYYDIPSPFPTLARGLFTVNVTDGRGDTKEKEEEKGSGGEKEREYRIVARGYDKFFNIGEVPWTTWAALEEHTTPPYTLTLKSNGCIIFIGALTPDKLLITSKHSLGPIQGVPESHAQVGERWLVKHLASVGKTREELARVLWDENWTAVAELCDDSFEEHVLPYSKDKTGLHLHGLNTCSRHFTTQPPSVVDAFAARWGFIPTASTTLQTIAEVKAFTEQIGKEGKWRGEALEGFVVRTHVAPRAPREKGQGIRKGESPYEPGSSFFFKVKFDEPYMMYRDWREVTKMLLTAYAKGGADGMDRLKLPKSKMGRRETRRYVKWVKGEIARDVGKFEGFGKGRGIIATRERFLRWVEDNPGKENSGSESGDEEGKKEKGGKDGFGKTVIVPIAIPGVGKTSIAVALTHIFGWGHTQSDDVKGKKPAAQFIKNVQALLKEHDVVIADKNNHLRQHRQAIRDATSSHSPPVRLLALNWSLTHTSAPIPTIHRIVSGRILGRGSNHQSLLADPSTARKHEEVVWQFIRQSEELGEGEVDGVVEMDVQEGVEEGVRRAVRGVINILGEEKVGLSGMELEERIGEGIRVAREYAYAKSKKEEKREMEKAAKEEKQGKKKRDKSPSQPRYFGILAEVDLQSVLDARFGELPKGPDTEFWEELKQNGRVSKRPHITIVHVNGLPGDIDLWERCTRVVEAAADEEEVMFKFRLGEVVSNGRVMSATVEGLQLDGPSDPASGEGGQKDEGQVGTEFVERLAPELRNRLHITVGTKSGKVPPVEGKYLVEQWKKGKDLGGVKCIKLDDVVVKGRLRGLFQ